MKLFRNNKILYLWLLLLLIITIEALLPFGSPPAKKFFLKKIIHVFAFGILAFLPTFGAVSLRQGIFCAFFTAILGYGLEYLQASIPTREYSATDIIATNIGVILGITVGVVARYKGNNQSSKIR